MRTRLFVFLFVLTFLLLDAADTALTILGVHHGTAIELNVTLAPKLETHSFVSLMLRGFVFAGIGAGMLALGWGKRHRFAAVDGELTLRKYYKNVNANRNIHVMILLFFPLVACGQKALGVLNNLMIISGIGSPYSLLLYVASVRETIDVRWVHLVMTGIVGVLLIHVLLVLMYLEAKRRAGSEA